MKRKRSMTLAEHDAQLKTEGRYDAVQALNREREEARLRRVAEIQRAAAPLVEALRASGLNIQSIGDLYSCQPYPKNVPVISILLEHVQRSYPKEVRDIIARAMAVPESRRVWKQLIVLFRTEQEDLVKDGLANALVAAVTSDLIGDLIALAKEREQGPSRIFFLRVFEKSRDERAVRTLMELGSDPELSQEAQIILRRLRSKKVKHPEESIRFSEGRAATRDVNEISANFDAQDVLAFLQRLKPLIEGGFSDDEILIVQKTMDVMDVDEEKQLEFNIEHHGTKSILAITISMDDYDAPDVTFRGDKQIVGEIRRELDNFIDERGL